MAESLQPLQLRAGQKLYDHGSLPPGVVRIVKGQCRILALDERNEPFTLQRLGPGGTAGDLALLHNAARLCV